MIKKKSHQFEEWGGVVWGGSGGRKEKGEMLQLKYNLKTKQQPKPCWAWQASHTFIPATEEAETRDHLSPRVQNQPGQQSNTVSQHRKGCRI